MRVGWQTPDLMARSIGLLLLQPTSFVQKSALVLEQLWLRQIKRQAGLHLLGMHKLYVYKFDLRRRGGDLRRKS